MIDPRPTGPGTHLRSNCAHCRARLPRILDVTCRLDHVTIRCTGATTTLDYSDDKGRTWHRLRMNAGQQKLWQFWADPDDDTKITAFEYTDRTITIGHERRYRARRGQHQETASVTIH